MKITQIVGTKDAIGLFVETCGIHYKPPLKRKNELITFFSCSIMLKGKKFQKVYLVELSLFDGYYTTNSAPTSFIPVFLANSEGSFLLKPNLRFNYLFFIRYNTIKHNE